MSRTKTGKAKEVFSLRLPQAVINDSKDVPDFRKQLEAYAVKLWEVWSESGGKK